MSTVGDAMTLDQVDAFFWAESGRQGQGLCFDCPLCVAEGRKPRDRGLIAVAFENPIDGGPRISNRTVFWRRDGNTLSNLTLDKAIDATKQWHVSHRGWLGTVVAGVIKT